MSFRVRVGVFMAVLAVLMAGTAIAIALELPAGGTFVDDDGNIHEGNIEAIQAEGITKGCNPPTNDRYCPDAAVTRGEMAAFLVRSLDPPSTEEDYFTDTADSVFEADINRLAAAGITKGCNPPANDRYCPDGRVTRGQMAAFLVRGFEYTDPGSGDLFTDDDGSVFEDDIDRLGTAEVTKGCNPPVNDRYCPDDVVKRDQMASFLARALGLAPIIPLPPPPPLNPEVFAIGDSVMEGVVVWTPRLAASMPNTTVSTDVSRQFSSGKAVLSSWLASGHDPDVVVVHLGTNGPPTSAQFADFMTVAKDVPRVLFLTVKQIRTSWETATNIIIRGNVPKYDNAELVDWYAVARTQFDMNVIDPTYGAHLWTTDVRRAYVNLIKDAVQDQ